MDTNIKLIAGGPDWAKGCEKCAFGLINPPSVFLPVAMYIVRAIQYDKGFLVLCDCKAGQMYEKYLTAKLSEIRAHNDYVSGRTWREVIEQVVKESLAPKVQGVGPVMEAA